MNEDRPSFDKIVGGWKDHYGVSRTSPLGTIYPVIPKNNLEEAMRSLVVTFLNNGYSFEEISLASMGVRLSKECWSEEYIWRMSGNDLKKAQLRFAKAWKDVVFRKEFTGMVISKVDPENRPIEEPKPEKKEKVLELDPSDRIKIDTSDIPDNPLDEDFLKELDSDE